MRILFLGDVVGAPGIRAIQQALPGFRIDHAIDVVIANAENATNGSGLSPRDYGLLRGAGIDAMTLGDHCYKKFEISKQLDDPAEPIAKPANFPASSKGKDHVRFEMNGVLIVLISVLGRTYMRPVDCPYTAVDRILHELDATPKLIFVDIHAEATADKQIMARHLDGKVTAVVGTHTHVQTADEQVLPFGTAFICDLGMTGPHQSIIGRRIDRVSHTMMTFEPSSFDVADGDPRVMGVIIEADVATGLAVSIERVNHSEPKA